MDKQELRQIIQEEIAKIDKQPIIKDVHLHIHGDGIKPIELLQEMASYQNYILKTRVLEKLNQD